MAEEAQGQQKVLQLFSSESNEHICAMHHRGRALSALSLQLSCKFLQGCALGSTLQGRGGEGTPPTASLTACVLFLTPTENGISVTQMKSFTSTAFRAV